MEAGLVTVAVSAAGNAVGNIIRSFTDNRGISLAIPGPVNGGGTTIQGTTRPDASQALANTRLPDDILLLLKPPLEECGFKLAAETIQNRIFGDRQVHQFVRSGTTLAIPHIPRWVLEDTANTAPVYALMAVLESVRTFIISSELTAPKPAFDLLFKKQRRKGIAVDFKSWDYLMDLKNVQPSARRQFVEEMFDMEAPPTDAPQGLAFDDDARSIVIQAMITAARSYPRPELFFKTLIGFCNFEDSVKQLQKERLVNIAKTDAMELVDWAIQRGVNSRDPNYTVIGELIRRFMDDVGKAEQDDLRKIVIRLKLIPGAAEEAEFIKHWP